MDLAVEIHKMTKNFPQEEKYGVVPQMRRAAVSIAANIAEGFGRYSYADKTHRYVQARGELIEVMTFVHYSERVHYISADQLLSLLRNCQDVHRLLNALIAKMRALESSDVLIPKS